MGQLIELVSNRNEKAMTTSLKVAEMFGKKHKNVMRAIENIMGGLPENEPSCSAEAKLKNEPSYFSKGFYTDSSGKRNKMYYMNRDGFSLLVMGFNGQKALEWKLKFIEAFNQMEQYIKQRDIETRLQQESMQFICNNLEMPTGRDYIKANTIADKAVSNMFGHDKMLKKSEMSGEMLQARDKVLKDTVELMAVKEKYGLDISVSKSIYGKYGKAE